MQLARAAGARVLATDVDPEACGIARRLGADSVVDRVESIEAVAEMFSGGQGFDAALVCAATPSSEPIGLASALCRDRGRVVVVGDVGLEVPRPPFYEKELELRLSRSYGPGRYDPSYEEYGHDYPIGYVRWTEQRNLAEFLRLVGQRLVDVDSLTTHRFPVEDAVNAYALITGTQPATDTQRPIGVLLDYPSEPQGPASPTIEIADRPVPAGPVQLGLIGAGHFATRILLPALISDERVRLQSVCTASGLTAQQVATRFGFSEATSDVEALIDNPNVSAVVIATRHDSHAKLAVRAIRAGKVVFCEKPLATTWDDLEDVAAAFVNGGRSLVVGFNRRFSPLIAELNDTLPVDLPRAILCRVNAGPLPHGHWLNDPVAGGGRIVGEFCHFLDLACHLADSVPQRVTAEKLGSEPSGEMPASVVVQVAFRNGSVASLQYLANGDPTVPKERIEVYAGGAIGLIDDFRSLEVVLNGKRRRRKTRRQEKGHREEVRAFVDLAAGGSTTVQTPESIFWSSALTLQVPVALSLGMPIDVDLPEALGGAGLGRTSHTQGPTA